MKAFGDVNTWDKWGLYKIERIAMRLKINLQGEWLRKLGVRSSSIVKAAILSVALKMI